mgnify:CR=1 FL=1
MNRDTKPIYTWDAKPSRRNLTAADIRACKGVRKLTQTTANTVEEAAAAAESGIDMLICGAANVELVRQGAPHHFLTAALTIPDYPTDEDILRGALTALKNGADSVMTARRLAVVEMLANEDIPVMGHLGLVPRKSTWRGGLRAVRLRASLLLPRRPGRRRFFLITSSFVESSFARGRVRFYVLLSFFAVPLHFCRLVPRRLPAPLLGELLF